MSASSTSATTTGPLRGVRVLDMTSVIMGPLATQLLGDQGADVITVERQGASTSRVMGHGPHPEFSGVSLNLLRNKRNVVVDLQHPAGRDVLLRLAATCDVLVTNLRPGPLHRLRLAYADVAEVRPDIVYCRAAGFPSDGDRAEEPAYDDIIQAASGLSDTMRLVHGEPAFLPTLVADKVTGMWIAQAICAALFHRERTGEGQEIEIPMLDAVTAFTLVEHGAGAIDAVNPTAAGYPRILSPARRPHPSKDGWVAILPYSREHYEAFFAATGLTGEIDPTMYADGRTRIERSDVLYGYVRRATPARTTAEWLDLCRRLRIPASDVATLDRIVADLPIADHPVAGPYRVIPPPVRFARTPAGVHSEAALPGQHTIEVLREIGMTTAQIDELQRQGAVTAADAGP
jgi:crotonobetainyl-CoA:carnitine CoA-transferase CaiB-like acyl-CoA transferase